MNKFIILIMLGFLIVGCLNNEDNDKDKQTEDITKLKSEMLLGEFEFSYTVNNINYKEYYTFDSIEKTEDGDYMAVGYLNKMYSSENGSVNNYELAVALYSRDSQEMNVLCHWGTGDTGSFFSFKLNNRNDFNGDWFFLDNGDIHMTRNFTGKRINSEEGVKRNQVINNTDKIELMKKLKKYKRNL